MGPSRYGELSLSKALLVQHINNGYRNKDAHYASEGLTLKQHNKLTAKVKVLMKTKHSALLSRHQHYMSTNFNELGRRPTLACQVWVANMEMAISTAKVAKGRFCTHETLQQLCTPSALPPTQPSPPVTLSNVSIHSPPHHYQTPFTTPGSHARHPQLSKTPYAQPHTTPHPLTQYHHPTLFPIFLRCHNTSRNNSPCFFQIFYPANAPQPYDKTRTHLHRLHIQKKVTSIPPGLV
jgi:hypothetical protein